jgi:hypothetical protein
VQALTEEDLAKEAALAGADRAAWLAALPGAALAPRDARLLLLAQEELGQCDLFDRIWPTARTHSYFRYLECVPYAEKLMGEWPPPAHRPSDAYEHRYAERQEDGLALIAECCRQKVHLRRPKQVKALPPGPASGGGGDGGPRPAARPSKGLLGRPAVPVGRLMVVICIHANVVFSVITSFLAKWTYIS